MRDRHVFIVSRRKRSGSCRFPNHFIEQELGATATTRDWATVRRIPEPVRQGREH